MLIYIIIEYKRRNTPYYIIRRLTFSFFSLATKYFPDALVILSDLSVSGLQSYDRGQDRIADRDTIHLDTGRISASRCGDARLN